MRQFVFHEVQEVFGAFAFAALPVLDCAIGDAEILGEGGQVHAGLFAEGFECHGGSLLT